VVNLFKLLELFDRNALDYFRTLRLKLRRVVGNLVVCDCFKTKPVIAMQKREGIRTVMLKL
jgi:hypothetical protein